MLFQGLTTGIGLLLIIPLLELVGFELMVSKGHAFTEFIKDFFITLNIPLTLPVILTLYVLLITLISIFRYRVTVLTIGIQQQYICRLRDQLFYALLHARWQYIAQHRMSDFIHSLSSQVQSVGQAAYQMLNLISQIILVIVYLILSMVLSWKMSLMALACAAFLFIFLLPLNRRIYQSGEIQLVSYQQIFQMLTEQLASLKMIKSYGSEKYHARKLQQAGNTLEQQHIRIARYNALTRMLYMIGAVCSFSILFYFAVHWLSVSLATLLLLLFMFSRLLPQVSTIQSGFQRLIHQLPAFDSIRQMLVECELHREVIDDVTVPTPTIQQHLKFNNVYYQYPGKEKPIITNLSFKLKHNESMALTGTSGVGKSTLADLIAGLLIPDNGEILCDDAHLEENNRLAWRKTVAYVTQEVYLFHDTIRNNLIWVKPDAKEHELWEALTLAAAEDFVQSLAQGLDTVIGDRGIRLSGGERQRLALARALLSQPQLLILDEATSALDDENERKIQQALGQLQGKLTVIVIAHRETTIMHVDKTIKLEA